MDYISLCIHAYDSFTEMSTMPVINGRSFILEWQDTQE